MNEYVRLREDYQRLKDALFDLENSDDYAYSSGKARALRAEIDRKYNLLKQYEDVKNA